MGCVLLLACSDSDDNSTAEIVVDGQYFHQIPDCDNRGNPEINCTEFVNFRDDTNVDILIGGGDIVAQATYRREGNTIVIEQGEGATFGVNFEILSTERLRRIEDQSIWEKQ